VPPRPNDADGLGVINPADREGAQQPAAQTLGLLRARYAEPNRRLARLVGPDFDIWS